MSRYAKIVKGEVVGTTRWPHPDHPVKVRDDDPRLKAFHDRKAEAQAHRDRHTGVLFADLLDELEERLPGFIEAVKARSN